MVPPRGRSSKGRQKISIEPIVDKERRQVTLSKRKSGLLKKASEIALLCGARVLVVVFSAPTADEAGKKEKAPRVWALGSPSPDHVLGGLCAPLPGEDDAVLDRAAVEATLRQAEETRARVAAEQARMDAVGEKVLQAMAGRRFWWEADPEALGEAELPEFVRALHLFRSNVQRHEKTLRSHPHPPPQ